MSDAHAGQPAEGQGRAGSSPWFDLVFHVLACIPVSHRDASRLNGADYAQWCARYVLPTGPRPRTLPADAELLGALYDAAPQAHRLHGFVLLHDGPDAFLSTAATPFAELTWPEAPRARLARVLAEQVPVELLELFRIALWSEVDPYLEARSRVVEPLVAAARAALTDAVQQAATIVRPLAAARLVWCHPLRQAGRLLQSSGSPVVAVGVPDPELGVTLDHVVTQACHEAVLATVPVERDAEVRTVATAPGFVAHMRREVLAISLHAARVDGTPLETPWRAWLARLYPAGLADLRRRLPWTLPDPVPGRSLAATLASGWAVPPDLRQRYDTLRTELEAARP